MGVRRSHDHQPGEPRELAVVAIEPLAGEETVVFDALLRARRAEARRRGIELNLQVARAHLGY